MIKRIVACALVVVSLPSSGGYGASLLRQLRGRLRKDASLWTGGGSSVLEEGTVSIFT